MSNKFEGMDRREALGLMATVATVTMVSSPAFAAAATKPLIGVMPVAATPYTTTGEIDHEDLAKEMAFIERCGASGAVWAMGGSDAPLLTKAERMAGMETVAKACRPLKIACVLACQSDKQDEMLEYVKKAESLNPDGVQVQPPPGKPSADELYNFFAPVAKLTKRPVLITTNATGFPSLELNLRMAKEFPNFGYIKEESNPTNAHVRADVAAKPGLRAIFNAAGGPNYLQEIGLGVDGQSTANAAYTDISVAIFKAYKGGKKDMAADAFSKMLLMTNAETAIPGTMRYIFVKRGVFKNLNSRKRGAEGQPAVVAPINLTPEEIAELDYRWAQMKPYLSSGV